MRAIHARRALVNMRNRAFDAHGLDGAADGFVILNYYRAGSRGEAFHRRNFLAPAETGFDRCHRQRSSANENADHQR